MYAKRSLKEYLDELSAKRPVPGGGSAAALEGAMGCALMSMAANYTIPNKRYAEFKERAGSGLARSEELRALFLNFMDADAEAYGRLSANIKKYDRESAELQKMYTESCDVPYGICRAAYDALMICRELAKFGSRHLVTDTAIAALMLESSFFGARYNVYINLKYITDKVYVEKTHRAISNLSEKVAKLKGEITGLCEEAIVS